MHTALHKLRGPSNRGEHSPDQPRSATPRLSAVDAKLRGQTAAQTPLPKRALEYAVDADRHRSKASARDSCTVTRRAAQK